MPELDFRSALETNWIKLGTLEMEATGSKVIVVQDEFRSGYECLTCRAKDIRMVSQTRQASVVKCNECGGTGKQTSVVQAAKRTCNNCEGKGWHICPDCSGTGTADGGLAHAQDSERRPTTGTIVSVGDSVTKYKRGDSVIYPSFAGDFFDLEAVDVNGVDVKVTIGILGENEIIARVRGHLELRRVKGRKALHTAA
jgi:DnaJ-class molecular chaperone